MNFGIIRSLAMKDVMLFFRNRFFALITVLAVVMYIAIYFVMPSTVDETLEVGLYAPVLPPAFEEVASEGIVFEEMESEEALTQAVDEGQYPAGVALPADIMEKLDSEEKPVVTLYFPGDATDELKEMLEVMIRELAFLQTGQPLAIETTVEVLGTDMLGAQIPLRDRLRPLFAVLIVLMETMGLASLISDEVARGTVRAILVTPTTVQDLFAAKAFVGVSLAFGQALLVTAVVGGLSSQPLIVVTALLLGSVLVTGFAFLIASLSKDLMSAMGWSMIIMVILMVPTFGVLFPGTSTEWAKVIPSYYMSDAIYQASSLGIGWGDLWQDLVILAGFDVAAVAAGIAVLRRKFR